ncbi:MAG: ABC transporter permease, partial [Prevotella sp.]|nr:ABC transporter permease [Prevotella sp.]
NNIVANILFTIVAVVLTAAAVVVKARLSLRHSFVPLLAGVAVAVVTVGAWMLFAVMTGNGAFSSPRLIPVVGLLCGAILEILGKALTYYYMGLRNHNDMYYFMLGNGATRQQALFYFSKRAMERTVTHFLRLISSSMFGCVPFIMWGMLLSGTEVVTAVAMQIVALAAMFTTALVALAVALAVASRYSMDEYGRLKEGADSNSSTNDDSVPNAPVLASESAASASSVSSAPVSSASSQTYSASYSASGSSVSEESGREENDVNPVV